MSIIYLPGRTPELIAALRRDCPKDCERDLEKLLRDHPPQAGKPAPPARWSGFCENITLKIYIDPDTKPIQILSDYLHEVAHALTPNHHHDHIFQAAAEKLYSYFHIPDWAIDRDYDCQDAAPLAQTKTAILGRAQSGAWHAEKSRSEGGLDTSKIAGDVAAADTNRARDNWFADLLPSLLALAALTPILAFFYFKPELPLIFQVYPLECAGAGIFVALLAAALWEFRS